MFDLEGSDAVLNVEMNRSSNSSATSLANSYPCEYTVTMLFEIMLLFVVEKLFNLVDHDDDNGSERFS